MTHIVVAPNKSGDAMKNAVRTLTFDYGTENALHKEIGEALGAETYFCHPYHSWETAAKEMPAVQNSI